MGATRRRSSGKFRGAQPVRNRPAHDFTIGQIDEIPMALIAWTWDPADPPRQTRQLRRNTQQFSQKFNTNIAIFRKNDQRLVPQAESLQFLKSELKKNPRRASLSFHDFGRDARSENHHPTHPKANVMTAVRGQSQTNE